MIVRTGLGQALACPPGTTDPSCGATVQYQLGLPAVVDLRKPLSQAGASASAIAWGVAAVAVAVIVMMSLGGRR